MASATATYDYERALTIDPAAADLGPGCLVHLMHSARQTPVAVGIPTRRDGVVHVEAVFASPVPAEDCWSLTSGDVWTLLSRGYLPAVSIAVRPHEYHTGAQGRLVRGTLHSVDLVPDGADELPRLCLLKSSP